jgi:hypothetical protein
MIEIVNQLLANKGRTCLTIKMPNAEHNLFSPNPEHNLIQK